MFIKLLLDELKQLSIGKIKDKIKRREIENAFHETFSKSKYVYVLDALSLNSEFNDMISMLGKGQTIDGERLLKLSLRVSPELKRIEIIEALKDFSLCLLHFFEDKTPELGKMPSCIQNSYHSIARLSLLPDCYVELLKEKNLMELDRQKLEKDYKELQESVAKRDKGDLLSLKIEESLDACNFVEAEKFLLESFESHSKEIEKAAEDAFQLAKLKKLQIEYREAGKYYEEAVRLSPENSLYLNDLGFILYELGEYNRAIGYYKKALDIDKRALGEEHPKVAVRLNNLGLAWAELGEYKRAIGYYEKALVIDKRVFGEEHPEVAALLNNLGMVWYSLGDYTRAIEYFEKALDIDKRALGEEHPNVAVRFNNLGGAWAELGEYKRAIGYYEKALYIDKRALGEEHPEVAALLNNLGMAWYSLGDNNRAIGYYEKALVIDKRVFGGEHPNVAVRLNNLGLAWASLGEYDRVMEYYKKAEKICLSFLGEEHPHTKDLREKIESLKQKMEEGDLTKG